MQFAQRFTRHKPQLQSDGTVRAPGVSERSRRIMMDVHIDKIGDLAIVECAGRVVRSEAAIQLRDVVTSQEGVQLIVLDLSQVSAVEGYGLGMLVFLRRWAYDHNIRFKLFNPIKSVHDRLGRVSSMPEFDIATLDEMMALLASTDSRHTLAA
jgi:anti-anti-sigma regulatory factor